MTSNSTEPPAGSEKLSTVPMTNEQRQDIARLCSEANVPDRSNEKLSAESAQQLINELRETAAKFLRK